MHDVLVLVKGYAEDTSTGRQRAGGTVTLIRGSPNVIVDTGDPWQRHEILDALALHEMEPAEIQYVINTHGHLDHVGNNNLFPHATFVLDNDVSRHAEYWIHDFSAGPMIIESPEGDGQITVLATPGHTDHDLSVLVRTDGGLVAIVGDLFEYENDDVDNAWRRWSRDATRQLESRERVLELAELIVPGHGDIFRGGRPP